MDDFEREGGRLVRRDRALMLDWVWNCFASVLALGVGVWFARKTISEFDPETVDGWVMVVVCIIWFQQLYYAFWVRANVKCRTIFFDLIDRTFGEVLDRRMGSPIEHTWSFDSIEAIEVARLPTLIARLVSRGALAQVRIAGERKPFVICATEDPLKAKAVVARVKIHLDRF